MLLEAIIIGKPIIATDVTGIKSMLEGVYDKLVENSQKAMRDSLAVFALQKRNGTILEFIIKKPSIVYSSRS